eukprot:m.59552 g.59552  ORF g.59552 m.59552 type:complete len:333 (-) comp9468_c0_seq2:2331-3329(-)
MGRKKIDIHYIEDAKKRKITLSKRKTGLLKKAYELSVLCGCEMAIVIFDSEQKLYTYGSRGIEKTIKKWQGTKKQPVTDWSNDDFDESSGKFRSKRNGGPAAGDDDGDDDSSDDDEGATAKAPTRKAGAGAAASTGFSAPAAGSGRKRAAPTALPSLMDAKPSKRHSNPRKNALEKGMFSIPSTGSVFGSGARPSSNVQPVLTPSLAASVGVAVADGNLAQQLMDISTADITGSTSKRRVTRSNSGTPNGAQAAAAPFSAGFGSGGSSDGLSPWLMSAVSSIEAPSSSSSSSMFPSSSGLGLTPPVAKVGAAAGVWPDSPSAEGRTTRTRSK